MTKFIKYLSLSLLLSIGLYQLFNPSQESLNSKNLFIVVGESMIPTIYPGEEKLVQEVNHPEELEVEDIIIYKKLNGENVIHRIIEIGNDGEWFAIAQGDNNYMEDIDKEVHYGEKYISVVGKPRRIRFEQIIGKINGK